MQRTFNKALRKPYFRNGSAGLGVNKLFPWTPAQITTALWLDADDASTITIATGVSQWDDKSGNARNATQATGANQPLVISAALNGKNVIRLDGSNDVLAYDGSFFVNTSYSIYAVVARRSNKTFNFILGGTGSSSNTNLHVGWSGNTTYTFAHIANNLNLTVSGYASPVYEMFGNIFNSAVGRAIYRNGSESASNTSTSVLSSYTSPTIGSFTDGPTQYYNGDIAELIATATALSTTDRQKMEGYLAWKWGLVADLPAGHPYKNSPPTL